MKRGATIAYSLPGRHTHRFSEADGGTYIADTVDYTIPFGALGRLIHRLQIKSDLVEIFDYRARRVKAWLA
jgi:ligand-binding SRPBCC domain-containing protein